MIRLRPRPGLPHPRPSRDAATWLLAALLVAFAPGAPRAGAPPDAAAPPPAPATAARRPLRVAADTSLEKVLAGLEASYEAGHPGVDLILTFGPSGTLRDQIMQRKIEADIFVSAGQAEVGALVIGGRVDPAHAVPVATNRLVLVTGARGRLSALTELRDPRIRRVALGNPPTVPVGRDGVAALQRAGVWPDVKGRLRYCATSDEIVGAVERHEVDAGLVYASDALGNPKVKVVMALDSFSDETRYVATPIKDIEGRLPDDAFIRYLGEAAVRARLVAGHFGTP